TIELNLSHLKRCLESTCRTSVNRIWGSVARSSSSVTHRCRTYQEPKIPYLGACASSVNHNSKHAACRFNVVPKHITEAFGEKFILDTCVEHETKEPTCDTHVSTYPRSPFTHSSLFYLILGIEDNVLFLLRVKSECHAERFGNLLEQDMRATNWYLQTTSVNADGLKGALPGPDEASVSCTLAPAKHRC
ncbi:hypothetical protein HAX54_040896, partial [Datura stramonium]|nr:hypothetical protein [Datura stramonium]